VERAHRLAREGLDETRRAVSALRGDRIPGPDQLRELVDEFTRDTSVQATFEMHGESRPLASEARLALYRAAQEALTNVRRPARPRQVRVVLRYSPDAAELEVVDAGSAARPPRAGGGYGLTGIRERAELLGGHVQAGPTPDGFRVHLWLPA
jgi:signal transduction histidine kinase